jgi:hypothetical protein
MEKHKQPRETPVVIASAAWQTSKKKRPLYFKTLDCHIGFASSQ